MSKHKVLTEAELASALAELDGWSVQDGEICAEFQFDSFMQAINFINKVANVAEEMDHHPEFCNSYNKVSFSFCTHDVGNKITDTDIRMAREINEIANSLTG